MSKFIYVASPYSNEDKGVMYLRSELALEFVARYYKREADDVQHALYSPIAYMAQAERAYDLPGTYEFWLAVDKICIDKSDELWVLMLHEVEKSTGVRWEVKYAQEIGLPVKLIFWDPSDGDKFSSFELTKEECDSYGWEWLGN
jgi:hypothetical protein